MPKPNSAIHSVVEQLSLGHHAAFFYRNRTEQLAAVIPYILIGLERNERCLYIADENSVLSILNEIERAGVEIEKATLSGALAVVTKHETYLKNGVFDPEEMIKTLIAEVEQSLVMGFSGFRATGEMTWVLNYPTALSRLCEYEQALDAQFPSKFSALCQYKESRFEPGVLSHALRSHPKILARHKLIDNPFYLPQGNAMLSADEELSLDQVLTAASADVS